MESKLGVPLMDGTLSYTSGAAQAVNEALTSIKERRGAIGKHIAHEEVASQAQPIDDVLPGRRAAIEQELG